MLEAACGLSLASNPCHSNVGFSARVVSRQRRMRYAYSATFRPPCAVKRHVPRRHSAKSRSQVGFLTGNEVLAFGAESTVKGCCRLVGTSLWSGIENSHLQQIQPVHPLRLTPRFCDEPI